MCAFKSAPAPKAGAEPNPKAVEAFVAGAHEHRLDAMPWDGLDPKATPDIVFNVRLNGYEQAVLKYIAKSEDRSLQKIVRRLLSGALAAELERLSGC